MSTFDVNQHLVSCKVQNFNMLKPNFGFAPAICIKKCLRISRSLLVWTLDRQLQILRKYYKNLFPAANDSSLNKIVAIDTFILNA